MPRPFIDPAYFPSDTSAQMAFAGNRLDRFSEDRADDCVERSIEDENARAIGIARGRVLMVFENETPRCLMCLDKLSGYAPHMERALLLGYDAGAPRLAVPLGVNPDDENLVLPDNVKLIDFRSLALQGLLGHEDLGLVAQGAATLAWHSSARFCGRCGSATEMRGGGVKRVCPSCDREQFPRTDPVVIMLTISGEKCLLGRSPHFPPGMFSALAGFVEAGESLEMAVRRETFEESGIRVGNVTYHASQPWPFPHTIMIGCYGEALDDVIDADMEELEECRWFTRDEIAATMDGNGPKNEDGSPALFIPPKMAIAQRLLTDWAKEKNEPYAPVRTRIE